jgi:hypothetical protein
MAESMSWWDGAAWRQTAQLWVWGSNQWLPVAEAWIWDGAAWRRCWAGGASLNTVTVVNTFGPEVDVSWTYNAPDPANWIMTFEVSFNFGSSWQEAVIPGGTVTADDARNPVTIALDSFFGYTDVQDTYIRVSMRRNGQHATGSPNVQFPPF